jgi:hypothetical protein
MRGLLKQHTVVCEEVCCCEGSVEVEVVSRVESQQENIHLCGQESDHWEAYDPLMR